MILMLRMAPGEVHRDQVHQEMTCPTGGPSYDTHFNLKHPYLGEPPKIIAFLHDKVTTSVIHSMSSLNTAHWASIRYHDH